MEAMPHPRRDHHQLTCKDSLSRSTNNSWGIAACRDEHTFNPWVKLSIPFNWLSCQVTLKCIIATWCSSSGHRTVVCLCCCTIAAGIGREEPARKRVPREHVGGVTLLEFESEGSVALCAGDVCRTQLGEASKDVTPAHAELFHNSPAATLYEHALKYEHGLHQRQNAVKTQTTCCFLYCFICQRVKSLKC
eukprot:705761-Amphidinium_carterae.3